jgi:serine protease AprX
MVLCPITGNASTEAELAEVRWLAPSVIAHIQAHNPGWTPDQGACPAYMQQVLLEILLDQGENAFHQGVQAVYPLDAEAAFGAIPTPLRLHADPRYTGKGVTIAMIDSDFYPHPDLTQPNNRIAAFVDVTSAKPTVYAFGEDEQPDWDGARDARPLQWHGTMTTTTAAGNGWLSHGLYRGLASDARLVLVKTYAEGVGITSAAIVRALEWVRVHTATYGISVVNLSLAGDDDRPTPGNPIDTHIQSLVDAGITVTAAAGNDGVRRLVPPASSPAAITVGGIDDENDFDDETRQLWHSNYGESTNGGLKPELIAPSIWVVAPVLPGTEVAQQALDLFERRGDPDVERHIAELKLVTPHYQHVDGTSFAAPLVASTVACMQQANHGLSAMLVRDLLVQTAHALPDLDADRQGHGVLRAGMAVAAALNEQHHDEPLASPVLLAGAVRFMLHAHDVGRVEVVGSWDGWQVPIAAAEVGQGVWVATLPQLPQHDITYKFLIDGHHWLDDPLNPRKVHDAYGGFNSFIPANEQPS